MAGSTEGSNSGESSVFTPLNMPIKMPSPRSKTTPWFKGKNLSKFINKFKINAKAAMLTEAEMAKLIVSYLSTKVKRTVEDLPEFKEGNWKNIVDRLQRLYLLADKQYCPSLTKFRAFVRKKWCFKKRIKLDKYMAQFLLMSNKLVENSQITLAETEATFVACPEDFRLS